MIWLRLWWYNNVRRHYWNWRVGSNVLPKLGYSVRAGKITRETYDWAVDVLKKYPDEK